MNRYFHVQQHLFTVHTIRRLLPLLSLTALLLFVGVEGRGQHMITSGNPNYSQDFNEFAGLTMDPLPNWSWTENPPFGTLYGIPGTYSGNNTTYALIGSADSTDRAFGGKFGMGEESLIFTARNNTGSTITGFTVGWKVEQYSRCTNATLVEFAYSVGTSVMFTVIPTASVTTSTIANPPCGNFVEIATTPIMMVPVSAMVANGQNIRFRFRFANSGSNNAHVGIDDFTMTPVVAPTVTYTETVPTVSTVPLGTTNKILYQVQVQVTNGPVTLTRVNVTPGGNWNNADVENFKLYHTSLQPANQLAVVSNPAGGGQPISFTGFSRSLPTGSSALFITCDVKTSCISNGKTISAGPTSSADFIYNETNINIANNTFDAANVHTITAAAALRVEHLNGQVIGCSTPLNVGTLPPGFDTVLTIRIRNIGCIDLDLTGINLNISPDFFIPAFTATTLAPDEFYELEIIFNPQAAGQRSTALSITSNAGNCTLNLIGTGQTSPDPVFPDVVTPNGDDHNEVFKVIFPRAGAYVFEVFNRSGGMVKRMEDVASESQGAQQVWEPAGCPDGVYYYRMTFNESVYRGAVTVIGGK